MPPQHTYAQGKRASVHDGESLATYRWLPATSKLRGLVFLLHGFRSHTRYNFLRNDPPSTLHQYEQSFISSLNDKQLAVFGQDHIGHGESGGLRAFFPSMDVLVSDLLAYVEEVCKELGIKSSEAADPNDPADAAQRVPMFLAGHSLGGTVAILSAMKSQGRFRGVVMTSAATEPPANMLGVTGRILRPFSGLGSWLLPTVPVLDLPNNQQNPELHELFCSDALNSQCKLRARVAHEFLLAYSKIAKDTPQIEFAFCLASGGLDTMVNPEAAQRFFERVSSEDKQWVKRENSWHNLMQEPGREEVWKLFTDWIAVRC